MKHYLILIAAALLSASATAATPGYEYTEASELTLVGKIMPGKTANPYHRVDTSLYKGFTQRENILVRMSSGTGCIFKTDSRSISIIARYGHLEEKTSTNAFSSRGFDLYIKKDGAWRWAGSGANFEDNLSKPITIVRNMDGSTHECLLYFPTYSEETSIKIGVEKGSTLEKAENPFRHRIALWGSSFTHGSCTSRAGMAYPSQFSRLTGMQMVSLATSGRCMLQDYFCDILVDVEADAFVFDAFSNPTADIISERLVPFIDRMLEAHPGKPLIFMQTIYREARAFNTLVEQKERAKEEMAEKIFREIKSTPEGRKKYRDVYLIYPNACPESHEASVDGTHPDNYGYTLYVQSTVKPILKILRKYGIR